MERDEMDSGEEVEQEGSEEMMALGSSSHTGIHREEATEEDDLLQEEQLDEEDSQREDHKSQESNHSRDDEEDGSSYFDNSMYQKFSSSYKFSMNDLQELKKAGQETPVQSVSRPSRFDEDEIQDEFSFEPI